MSVMSDNASFKDMTVSVAVPDALSVTKQG